MTLTDLIDGPSATDSSLTRLPSAAFLLIAPPPPFFSPEDTYERTLTVDGKDTTLVIMDTWSNDKPVRRVEIILDVVTGTPVIVIDD